jgi:importin subunit beta-1
MKNPPNPLVNHLQIVMQLLQQAATMGSGTRDQNGFDLLDYIDSLNEGILEAYSGIILGLKGAGKSNSDCESLS